ncbi:M48 family metalloprotease [Saccharopolyspora sp. NPDC050389]|uniref:M48 family metalloprotease n=1 Tax=Saccharopolyspora sp. NPDC050389 TaxID=3155516 RepID=UPI0034003BD5
MTAPAARDVERVPASGTTLRFALLVVLFAASSAAVLTRIIRLFAGDPENNGFGCMLAAGVADPDAGWAIEIAFLEPAQEAALDACEQRFAPSAPAWILPLALGAVAIAAAAAYWVLPWWKGRPGRVVPVDELDATGELRRVLDELVSTAGLARAPKFVVDPAARTASAFVFGRWRRYTVCLHGGLVVRRLRNPDGFRAVVLHELAHIRNLDVDVTYGTGAIWRVFLAAVLVPDAVLLILNVAFARSGMFSSAGRWVDAHYVLLSVVLVLLVYLARAEVLRSRELHADLDAARWGADVHGWQHGSPAAAGRARRLVASFAGLWRTHPGWAQRRHALADQSGLFGVQALPMFLTGAVTTIATGQVATTTELGAPWVQRTSEVLGAGLIAAIAGVALWRATIHAVRTGRRPPSGIRAGLWIGAGLVVGEVAMVRSQDFDALFPDRPQFLLSLVLVVTVAAWWTAQLAELSVRGSGGSATRPAMLFGLAATWLIVGVWLAWWQTTGYLLAADPMISAADAEQALLYRLPELRDAPPAALSLIATVQAALVPTAVYPSLLWAAAALWLVPLLVWERHSATMTRLRRVVLIGASGGGLAVLLVGVLHVWRSPDDQSWLTVLLFSTWLQVLLIGAVVITAIVAAALADRFSLLAALIAAGIAAFAGLVAVVALQAFDGFLGPLNARVANCGWHPAESWFTVKNLADDVLGFGIFLAAAAVLVTAGVRAVFSRRERPRPSRPSGRGGVLARRACVAAVCVAVLALTAVIALEPRGQATSVPPNAQPTDAESSTLRTAQLLAWVEYGGRDIIVRLILGVGEISFTPADPELFEEAELRATCADLEGAVADARAYFQVPDEELQQEWAKLLASHQKVGSDCRTAFDTRDVELLFRTWQAATAAMQEQERLLPRMREQAFSGCTPETEQLRHCGLW